MYNRRSSTKKPAGVNQIRKEQCRRYTGTEANRGGGRPVRLAPSIASGIGWQKDVFWTIPEYPSGERTEQRANSFMTSELLHVGSGQWSAPTKTSGPETPCKSRASWEQLQFAISMAPPICLSLSQECSIICAELKSAARIVNKKAMIKEKSIRIVSPDPCII